MELPKTLFDSFEIDEQRLPATENSDEKYRVFRQLLIQRIDQLVHHDFEKLKWMIQTQSITDVQSLYELHKSLKKNSKYDELEIEFNKRLNQ